jgi:hypothetical protein
VTLHGQWAFARAFLQHTNTPSAIPEKTVEHADESRLAGLRCPCELEHEWTACLTTEHGMELSRLLPKLLENVR